MNSRKFDITEAFIQALQEQENKKIGINLREGIEPNSEEGTCPVCHSDDLEYNSLDVDDYGVIYPFICNACGTEGNEYYDMSFSEIIDNHTDESSKDEGVCPKCGADLDYGSLIPEGTDIYYEVECPQCDFIGKEWYDLSFAGQEVKGKKQEARSHKEDNEKAAPRTTINKNGREVKTRNMVNVSNPAVGNNSYHNQKGNQYFGTTEAEYASKRNKTGQKDEFGYDKYLADYDTMKTPVDKYQYEKTQAELLNKDAQEFRNQEKKARNYATKYTMGNTAHNLESQVAKHNQNATNIVNQEKERIAKNDKSVVEPKNKDENFGIDMVTDIAKSNIELGSTVLGALGGTLGLGESKERRTLGERKVVKETKQEFTKEDISNEFFDILTDKMGSEITASVMQKCGTTKGDITPEQSLKSDEIIRQLSDLYAEIVMQNM